MLLNHEWIEDKYANAACQALNKNLRVRRLPSTTQLVQKYTQYGQTVRQRYDANNLLPRQFVMKESRNQKGCHWGYKQDEEEIEKCGLGSICREYKSDRTSCISPRWLSCRGVGKRG